MAHAGSTEIAPLHHGTAVEWQHSGALADAAFERLVAESNPK